MEEKHPSFLEKIKMSPSQLWENHKLFLVLFGLVLIVIKFQDFFFDLLVKSSKKQVAEATKQNQALLNEQNKANDKSDQLRQEAEDMGKNRPEVDENWHKK